MDAEATIRNAPIYNSKFIELSEYQLAQNLLRSSSKECFCTGLSSITVPSSEGTATLEGSGTFSPGVISTRGILVLVNSSSSPMYSNSRSETFLVGDVFTTCESS